MYTNRNHPTMVLPLLIVIFYFLHFQLIFKPISLLSMIVILLIVPLCYSIFRKFSSSRFPVLLLLFSTLIIILVFKMTDTGSHHRHTVLIAISK